MVGSPSRSPSGGLDRPPTDPGRLPRVRYKRLSKGLPKGGPLRFLGAVMPRKPKPLPTWEIYIARAKAKHLGSVEAADADAAIEAAAKEFRMDPKRLMAVRRA